MTSFLDNFAPLLLNAVLIVVGWLVIHSATKSRELSKSRRDFVIKLCENLRESVDVIHTKARYYHLAA